MSIRREPALLLALVAACIQVFSAFLFELSDEQQGVLNAVAIAATGLVTAAMVRSEQLAPALLGFIQAALALGLAFGLELTTEQQSIALAFAAAIVGMFVRTQVVAPVPPAPLAPTTVAPTQLTSA